MSLLFPFLALAQGSKPSYPAHLPYSFTNFVWWTDDELRAELKKRIPGLTDEVATTTAAEGRIRDALTAMLKAKGITAQVMSNEPSPSALEPPPQELFGYVSDEDVPAGGKPSIAFELNQPQVVIGKISVQSNDPKAQKVVERELRMSEGQSFTESGQAFSQWQIERALRREAYFGEQVFFRRMPPYRSGDRYLVDINVIVDAGPKYHVASISADLGPLFEGRDLSRFFSVKPGDPAVPDPFRQLGPQLRAYYEQNGFADAQIKSNPTVDSELLTVSYALQVIPGQVYHLRSLSISKLRPEQEKKVRELLGMAPGDIYRDQAVMALYERIAAEPLLKGYRFSFFPKRDKVSATVDLSLTFFREDAPATVTVQ